MNNNIENKIDEIENRMRKESQVMGVWDNHFAFHNKCADFIKNEGLWLEFGVFRGRSICQFAERTPGLIYGFDSFEGLPETWDSNNPKGTFSLNGLVPDAAIDGIANESAFDPSPTKNTKSWPANVRLVKGWFDQTLPSFLKDHLEPCALIHIDSDLYSSCKTILDLLEERIIPGTILVFDEINDYPDYRNHEIKAFAEFLIKIKSKNLDYNPLVHQNLGYSQGCFIITRNDS